MKMFFAKNYTTFTTVAGVCAIAWNGDGISCFQLPTFRLDDIETWRSRRVPNAMQVSPDASVLRVIDNAKRYFDGEVVDFASTPVDLRGQPEFFVRIYAALRQVPHGKTTTYGELAKCVGAGLERSREVGVAMATNPVPLIVPCHRVLAAGGQLSGFSAPGGREAKARMLGLEGVVIESVKPSGAPPVTQTCFAFQ
jgi:methylated-DNA-[protein]-cysteine S-methyltransferase